MDLNIIFNICIFITIFTSSSLSKKYKKPYQLAKIGETYADYRKREVDETLIGITKYHKYSKDNIKMTFREFYDTLHNVQFIQLPDLGPYNYDHYVHKINEFCLNSYVFYPRFLVISTLKEFVSCLNDLVTEFKELVKRKEKEQTENEQINQSSLYDDLRYCFNHSLHKQTVNCGDHSLDKQTVNCVVTRFSDAEKLDDFKRMINLFRVNVNEIALKYNSGIKFNYKMLPILNAIMNAKFNTFQLNGTIDPKTLYAGYLGVDMSTKESTKYCKQNYKPLDKATYISKKIGYYLFPANRHTSFSKFKLRRIQFIYHLRALFKEMGIPNNKVFNSLKNATKSIDKSYYSEVNSVHVIANEVYESYVMRIMVQGYYPLPKTLWKLDMANIIED